MNLLRQIGPVLWGMAFGFLCCTVMVWQLLPPERPAPAPAPKLEGPPAWYHHYDAPGPDAPEMWEA